MPEFKNAMEILIGVVVLVLSGIFVFVVYKSGTLGESGDGHYKLIAFFDRADGITVGSNISVSGIKVGKVLTQTLDTSNYTAKIEFSVINSVQLPLDTSAEIVSEGFLGAKYIALVPGSDSNVLKEGDQVEFTQSSMNIESLIGKMVFGLEGGNKGSESAGEDPIDTHSTEDTPSEDSGSVSFWGLKPSPLMSVSYVRK